MEWRKGRLTLIAIAALLVYACGATAQTNGDNGRRIYEANCRVCHGQHGEGALGPELLGERAHKNEAQTVDWIEHPLPPMPRLYPAALSERDVRDVAKFVMTL
jgi:ubiquinol-cytochrome c reductase cytochrome c subunit